MQIVFATTTTTVSAGLGNHTVVHEGEHWWAGDPIVEAHPGLFTTDERNGLCSSVPLPDVNQELTVEEATAAVEAAQTQLDEAKARAEAAAKEKADARESQAPVEQATKAPGEKRTTRRG